MRRLYCGLMLLCLAACADDQMLPPSPTPAQPYVLSQSAAGAIRFFPETRDGPAASPATFSIADLSDLNVLVSWRSMQETAPVLVDLISPEGRVFRAVEAQDERIATHEGRGTWVLFPVGGTEISNRNLTGTWQVRARLPDGSSTISAPFVLQSR